MITTNNAKSAQGFYDSVRYSGKGLAAVPGSPVGRLVETLHGETLNEEEILIEAAKVTTIDGGHTGLMDDIVPSLAKVIGNILDVAKNDVVPLCRDIQEEVISIKEEGITNDLLELGSIMQIDLGPLLSDVTFSTLVEPYAQTRITSIPNLNDSLNTLMSNLTKDDIRDLLVTGSPGIDSKLEEYLTPDLEGFYYDESTDYSGAPFNLIVVSFILTLGILNGKSEKVMYIPEDEDLKLIFTKHMAILGGVIAREIIRLNNAVANGKLLYSGAISSNWHPSSRVIKVVGKTYRKWVKEKGSPEAIIGFYIQNQFKVNYSGDKDLQENPEKYVSVYNSRVKLIKGTSAVKELGDTKRAIRDVLSLSIRDGEGTIEDKERLHANLKKALFVDLNTSTDVIGYIRDVVCTTLEYSSDVRFILSSIDVELKENEDMDLAVCISTAKLIGNWLSKQITII